MKRYTFLLALGLIAAQPSVNAESIQVDLHYNSHADKPLKIQKATVYQVESPRPDRDGTYALTITDRDWNELLRVPFDVPDTVQSAPPLDPVEEGPPAKLDNFKFSIMVPMVEGAYGIELIGPDGNVLDSTLLKHSKVHKGKPRFKVWKQAMDWLCPPVYAAAYDITFVSDKYGSDEGRFNSDVAASIEFMTAMEPYKTRASQLVFRSVWNEADLGCAHSSTMNRLITCNDTAVKTAVNNAGAAWDEIIVLVKDSTYGGSGGSQVCVSYNGTSMNQVVAHEFGHTGANLHDEYQITGSLPNQDAFWGNIWKGLNPPSEWTDARKPAYALNYWSQTQCSLMRSLSCVYFNPVSIDIINKSIDYRAGAYNPEPVNAPPTILANLEEGQVLRWKYAIESSAADDSRVARMELWIDGKMRTAVESDYLKYNWSIWSRWEPNGPADRIVVIKAFDDEGLEAILERNVVTWRTKNKDY